MFSEKLLSLRKSKNMTQPELCELLGITRRTLSNYENGRCYPKSMEIVAKIGDVFGVGPDYLMSNEEQLIQQAEERIGSRGRASAERLIHETSALFAGGELSNEDKEYVFRSISEIFWDSKTKNKKYASRKHNKSPE